VIVCVSVYMFIYLSCVIVCVSTLLFCKDKKHVSFARICPQWLYHFSKCAATPQFDNRFSILKVCNTSAVPRYNCPKAYMNKLLLIQTRGFFLDYSELIIMA